MPFSLLKVGVVGCGAVGSFYGAHLARAGEEVCFLLRSDFDVVRQQGVLVSSPQGDFRVHPRCARVPEEVGQCDLVLIALKTTANDQFPHLLPPLVGPHTALLTLQNGLGNEEALARLFPARQVMGGLCFVCLNRLAPGRIRHLDHGLVVLGEFERAPEPRTQEIAARFRQGVPCEVTENLRRAHWEKLVWNVPFNGLGVASVAGIEAMERGELEPRAGHMAGKQGECLTTDRLLADGRWFRLVRELMLEVIGTARALGLAVEESVAGKQIERTRTMGAYRASTLLDFERGLELELGSLFLEPLRQSRAAGQAVPRLENLCRVLTQLEANSRLLAG